ncbi:longitudinals lacking protein, isoforms A/B/D/L-like [Bemisia tabaci]|uniref:longitudinals lacking protein, isoforms A/B/D/L-like n=1 Tax=Bemisia tabaci TaxID=7038 RepID=UPI003B281CA3
MPRSRPSLELPFLDVSSSSQFGVNDALFGVSDTPFPCQQCGRQYKRPQALRAHIRKECGKERKFQCHLCSYKALLKHHLTNHLLLVHKIDARRKSISCA